MPATLSTPETLQVLFRPIKKMRLGEQRSGLDKQEFLKNFLSGIRLDKFSTSAHHLGGKM